jgi:hypothetical protein
VVVFFLDPLVVKGLPKIRRIQLSDDDLNALRSKYVKRRLASVGQQPQVMLVQSVDRRFYNI